MLFLGSRWVGGSDTTACFPYLGTKVFLSEGLLVGWVDGSIFIGTGNTDMGLMGWDLG